MWSVLLSPEKAEAIQKAIQSFDHGPCTLEAELISKHGDCRQANGFSMRCRVRRKAQGVGVDRNRLHRSRRGATENGAIAAAGDETRRDAGLIPRERPNEAGPSGRSDRPRRDR